MTALICFGSWSQGKPHTRQSITQQLPRPSVHKHSRALQKKAGSHMDRPSCKSARQSGKTHEPDDQHRSQHSTQAPHAHPMCLWSRHTPEHTQSVSCKDTAIPPNVAHAELQAYWPALETHQLLTVNSGLWRDAMDCRGTNTTKAAA